MEAPILTLPPTRTQALLGGDVQTDAPAFYDRVWAAIRDKYRSEVSGGREEMRYPLSAPPPNASQRDCRCFWHRATLASWVVQASSAEGPPISCLSLPPGP